MAYAFFLVYCSHNKYNCFANSTTLKKKKNNEIASRFTFFFIIITMRIKPGLNAN